MGGFLYLSRTFHCSTSLSLICSLQTFPTYYIYTQNIYMYADDTWIGSYLTYLILEITFPHKLRGSFCHHTSFLPGTGSAWAQSRTTSILTCLGRNSRTRWSKCESTFYSGRERKRPGYGFLETESRAEPPAGPLVANVRGHRCESSKSTHMSGHSGYSGHKWVSLGQPVLRILCVFKDHFFLNIVAPNSVSAFLLGRALSLL